MFYNNTLSKLDSVVYISNFLYLETYSASIYNAKDCYTHLQAGQLLEVEVLNCLFQSNTAQNEIIFVAFLLQDSSLLILQSVITAEQQSQQLRLW